jgi:tetratricopeptide (TPR) repeat protein
VAVIAAGLIVRTNISVVQADVIYRHAQRLASGAAREEQVRLFQRALSLQPPQDYAFAFLGDAYLAYAGDLAESEQRHEVLAQAEEALQNARALNPLNPEHTVRLGDLHLTWAGFVSSHAGKESHFRTALDYYAQALRLSPNMAPFSERYTRARREYSAFLAESQISPPVPSTSQPENP